MAEKEIITGTLENSIFASKDSMYKVISIKKTNDEEVVVVGNFGDLEEGLLYDFTGEFKAHPKYGQQFFCDSYVKSKSFTKPGLIQYLSSDKFPGIGVKLALAIVNTLGLKCIELILEDPKSLDQIKGLSDAKKQVVYETISANYIDEQVLIRLYDYGLSSRMVKKLLDKYGSRTASYIEEDPYRLIYEVDGFGFKKSDALAMNLGFKLDDKRRIKASIAYTINYVCYQQGFTFLTLEQILNSAKKLLETTTFIQDDKLLECLDELVNEKKVTKEDNRYYDSILYKAEVRASKKLIKISQNMLNICKPETVEKALEYVQKNISIEYTPLQKQAIINALSNKLSIITGGPGTGKSTILNGILKCYAYINNLSMTDDEFAYKVTLASPTGRAAKRMTETTNFKASTVHRTLGYNFSGEFTHDETNPLTCSLLVVDEASMLDISLFASLLSAISTKCQIILVGDANQLPSVGPGNVLSDLMNTEIFKTTKLNQIMRQASDSNIITLSHMILSEKIDYRIFSSKKEVYFYQSDSKSTIETICKILDRYISTGGDLYNGIQILAPMYAGEAGIDKINQMIQERYNPETEKILKREFRMFKKGDKVLQLKNDSEMDIMNGDIGRILDIVKTKDQEDLLIDFDGRVVTYKGTNVDNLSLAYAISVHKSQGSEFENVIIPILPSYQVMLRKKIIYTAATRAKKKLIVLGQFDSIERAIHQGDYERQTTLYNRISSGQVDNTITINDPEIPFDTLGEYQMEGITPYSFM